MYLVLFAALVLLALLAWAWWRCREDRRARAFVCEGDLWELVDGSRFAGLYEVVKANCSTEAGPDSWEMKHATTGRRFYMHGDARASGRWILCMRDGVPMRERSLQLRSG